MNGAIRRWLQRDDINFILSNRIPRVLATRFMGWFSRIENPVVYRVSMRVWRRFSDLDLRESRQQQFRSLHDCFTRELRDGARPPDPDPGVILSPCDAVVGAYGRINAGTVLQAKGSPYALSELVADTSLADSLDGGVYVTLRIKSSMYHRFHAPDNCLVEDVHYVSGDAWNVNPPALRRVRGLFCRNERAVIRCRLDDGGNTLVLVPVAAILVAGIRLHFCDVRLHLRYSGTPFIHCDARLARGQEMGWFEHGSTIIVLAPLGFSIEVRWEEGSIIRAGQAILRRPAPADDVGGVRQ